jgi:hypothetical protein
MNIDKENTYKFVSSQEIPMIEEFLKKSTIVGISNSIIQQQNNPNSLSTQNTQNIQNTQNTQITDSKTFN